MSKYYIIYTIEVLSFLRFFNISEVWPGWKDRVLLKLFFPVNDIEWTLMIDYNFSLYIKLTDVYFKCCHLAPLTFLILGTIPWLNQTEPE